MRRFFQKAALRVTGACFGIVVVFETYYKITEKNRKEKLALGVRSLVTQDAPKNFNYEHCLLCAKIIECGFEEDHVTENTIAESSKKLRDIGFSHANFFYNPQSNAHGTVVLNDEICFVVFRGSREIKDFENDTRINFTQIIPEKDIAVHEGFHECCISIQEEAIKFIKETNPQGLPIIIAGHSLGGANAVLSSYLATIAPKKEDEKHFSIKAIYTFGQPRVGNTEFVKHYQQVGNLGNKLFRIVNKSDVVASLPPVIFGYRHVGNELFFDEWNIPHWNRHWLQLIPHISHEFRMKLWHGKVSFVDDHFMISYLDLFKDRYTSKEE